MNFTGSPMQDEEVTLELTPLIDMVFQLLIFFLLTTTFAINVKEGGLEVDLPRAKSAQIPSMASHMVIAVLKDGRMVVGGESVSEQALQEKLEKIYKEIHPESQFSPHFLDETFDRQFERDRIFMRNIGIFAGIAIFIACLGLIGLVAFSIEQRRKEIAIRKILGSGEKKIFSLLSVDFLKWVVIANVIAWPCAHFAMSRWLNAFVFRTPFQPWPFLVAAAGTLFFAFLTISFQTLRATRTNPADVLRCEG